MSAQCPINANTVQLVGRYNQTAKHLTAAGRHATARAVKAAASGYSRALGAPALPAKGLREQLIKAEHMAGQFVVGAVERVSDRADRLVDGVARRAVAGIEFLDEKTAWSREVPLFNALRQLGLPVAKASLRVAEQMADASRRLSERAAGPAVPLAKAAKAMKTKAMKTKAGKPRVGAKRSSRAGARA